MKYIIPSVYANSFTCPHCNTLAKQDWWSVRWNGSNVSPNQDEIRISNCQSCNNRTLWILNKMYYPDSGTVPSPNPEMPDNVKKIYLEAASIHTKSPRGSAALLRLGIQLLCIDLGGEGKNINADIKKLVEKGLPLIVKESLDIVRVTGNEAVHPGVIDTDDPDTVMHLFELLNVIVEYMIALPKKVSGLHNGLPANKLKEISNRDGKP